MIINAIQYNGKRYFLTADVMHAIQNESALATGVTVVVETSNSVPDLQHYIESGCQALEPIFRAKFINALQFAIEIDKNRVLDVSDSISELWQSGGVFDFPIAAPAAPAVAVAPAVAAAAPAAPAIAANSSDATPDFPWNNAQELLDEIRANSTRDRAFLARMNHLNTLDPSKFEKFIKSLNLREDRECVYSEYRLARERARDKNRYRRPWEVKPKEQPVSKDKLSLHLKLWNSAQELLDDVRQTSKQHMSERMRNNFPKVPINHLRTFIADLPPEDRQIILIEHPKAQKRAAKQLERIRDNAREAEAQQQMLDPRGVAAFSAAPVQVDAQHLPFFATASRTESQRNGAQGDDAQSTHSTYSIPPRSPNV